MRCLRRKMIICLPVEALQVLTFLNKVGHMDNYGKETAYGNVEEHGYANRENEAAQ